MLTHVLGRQGSMLALACLIGFIYFLHLTWVAQVRFGNWLKHFHKKNPLRFIWWSSCDMEGWCIYEAKEWAKKHHLRQAWDV